MHLFIVFLSAKVYFRGIKSFLAHLFHEKGVKFLQELFSKSVIYSCR